MIVMKKIIIIFILINILFISSFKLYLKADNSSYNLGFEAGVKFCKEHPSDCGLNIDNNQCGNYDFSKSILSIPCVNINNKQYWLDLQLQQKNNNISFTLNDFGGVSQPLSLTILHVNDTHSHIEPVYTKIKIDGDNYTYVEAGGYARIAKYVNEIKNNSQNVLFLHAGDAVQGTLFYTEFKGRAGVEVMNMMNIDAFVPGNHEFDNGAEVFANDFVDYAKFPIVCADIDFSQISILKKKIKPYIIKKIHNESIAIVGIDTDATKYISNPGNKVTFKDYIESAKKIVNELQSEGINKIIFLTHLGYNVDKQLAKEVEDIDIIVGGHSHTPLGNLKRIGLNSKGNYPTVIENHGKIVLVVTAYKWGLFVGNLKVKFDSKGVIIKNSWKDSLPVMLIGDKFMEKDSSGNKKEVSYNRKEELLNYVKNNPMLKVEGKDIDVENLVEQFTPAIEKLKHDVVGKASADLIHVRLPGEKDSDSNKILKYGSMLAPLVAESMLEKAEKDGGAELAIQNAGGVRRSLYKGDITVGDIYEVLPFGNTLVVIDMKGSEIKDTLESAIDRSLIKHTNSGAFPYLAGARMFLDITKPKGERIVKLEIKQNNNWNEILPNKTYRIVTHSYLASGGDYYNELKNAKGFREDLGFIDAEVFMEYVKQKGTISPVSVENEPIQFVNKENLAGDN